MTVPNIRPTQADVARLAGVSASTVSYLLSGRDARKETFPPATRRRVEQAAAELGYVINQRARALRRQRSELIGIAYVPPVTPWFDEFSAQAREYLAGRDYGLIQIPFAPGATDVVQRSLGRGYLDGIIAICEDDEDAQLIRHAAADGIPITVFSDAIVTDDADVVDEHQREAVVDAVRYLAERERTKIAFLDFEPAGAGLDSAAQAVAQPSVQPNSRQQGYLDGMTSAGLLPRVITSEDTRDATYTVVSGAVSDENAPDALISFSDRGAVSAIWAAQHVGIRVPDDLAIIGCGNTAEGQSVLPQLTSLGIPQGDFATIFDRVLQRSEDPQMASARLSLPWAMFVRGSA
jgi:LacI family transcriptional regulator